MQDRSKGRLKTIENDESIVFKFSGLQFVNVATIPFITMSIMLLLILSSIFYGLYYAPIAYKPLVAIFSFPFVGLEAIVIIISFWWLTRKSLLKINSEQIEIEFKELFSLKRDSKTKFIRLKQEDIISIKNIQFSMPADYQPKNIHPEVIIVTEEQEYRLSSLSYIPTNKEAN